MKNVIAHTLAIDPSELSDYRYQGTRTTRAIYAIGDQYFSQGKTAPKDKVGSDWVKWPDQFYASRAKTFVWCCNAIPA